jgi:hypothetical protein
MGALGCQTGHVGRGGGGGPVGADHPADSNEVAASGGHPEVDEHVEHVGRAPEAAAVEEGVDGDLDPPDPVGGLVGDDLVDEAGEVLGGADGGGGEVAGAGE